MTLSIIHRIRGPVGPGMVRNIYCGIPSSVPGKAVHFCHRKTSDAETKMQQGRRGFHGHGWYTRKIVLLCPMSSSLTNEFKGSPPLSTLENGSEVSTRSQRTKILIRLISPTPQPVSLKPRPAAMFEAQNSRCRVLHSRRYIFVNGFI